LIIFKKIKLIYIWIYIKNKEELRLLSDIFETVTSFTEMFEREYSLKVIDINKNLYII